MIGGGLIVFVFNPGTGEAIIIGSALTIIPAEMILQRKKKWLVFGRTLFGKSSSIDYRNFFPYIFN